MAELKNGEIYLKIATYNIAAGRYDRSLRGICRDIKEADADIIGLQEIDMLVNRSGRIDMLKSLSYECGYEYRFFARTIDFDGGEYGIGIMSKYPLTHVEILPLDGGEFCKEDRVVCIAEISVLGERIDFLNTHISYESADARRVQLEQISKRASSLRSYIMTGDFNTDDFSIFSVLGDCAAVNNSGNYLPSFTQGGKAIDNIVISNDWQHLNAELAKPGSSDHRLLSASLKRKIK